MADYTMLNGMVTAPELNTTSYIQYPVDSIMHMFQSAPAEIFKIILALNTARESTTAQKYIWAEDQYRAYKTQIASTVDASATSITVDDASFIKANDVMHNELTGENILITDVDYDTNVVTAVRNYGTTVTKSMVEDVYLFSIGTVNPLGGDIVAAIGDSPADRYNYCQIFKETAETDRSSADHMTYENIPPRLRNIQKAGAAFMFSMETSLLWGQRKADSGTFDKMAYQTGGLFESVSTNVTTDANGTLTLSEFTSWLTDKAFYDDSDNKLVIVGSKISQALTAWFDNKIQLNPEYKKLGVSVAQFVLPDGRTVDFMHHKFFSKTPGLAGTALAIPLDKIRMVVKRAPMLEMNLATTADKFIDQWIAEVGWKVLNEACFAVLNGVTGYSVS